MNNITTDETDDPVMIAVKEFNGDRSSKTCWRKYFRALVEKHKDYDKAQTVFMEAVYVAQTEIKNDGIPDFRPAKGGFQATPHIHAKYFTNALKRII